MARRAGNRHAAAPATATTAITIANVSTSWGATPKSWLDSARVAARLARPRWPGPAEIILRGMTARGTLEDAAVYEFSLRRR